MRKILESHYDMMRKIVVKPESQSEIAFLQNFGAELFEAEAWLRRFVKTEDEMYLSQAFNIYYYVYVRIGQKLDNIKIIYLENVSPKLVSTKNCEISIPGLYRPSKPIIKISWFYQKLTVLSSK